MTEVVIMARGVGGMQGSNFEFANSMPLSYAADNALEYACLNSEEVCFCIALVTCARKQP